MTTLEIFVGLGLIVVFAVACQIVATRLRLPTIVLLLPVGFVAGNLTDVVNPNKLFGAAFTPMVSLSVAVILFDGVLGLCVKEYGGHTPSDVGRLLRWTA